MLKKLFPVTLAFDCEWIPDVPTIRRTYGLAADLPDQQCIEHAWADAGATAENPQPFLKVILCRIVSVCGVVRKKTASDTELKLVIFPPLAETAAWDEARIIRTFLAGTGKNEAQLVGFNCLVSDLPALVQRAMVHNVSSPEFGRRPDKPWEGADYFSSFSDHVFDIGKTMSFGRGMPTMHQAATACGIPGKIDVAGDQVFELWKAGKHREIVEYNVFDAITTYLLWLRCANFAGLLPGDEYRREQDALDALLQKEIAAGHSFLQKYADQWVGGGS